jgi:hypothetical protein
LQQAILWHKYLCMKKEWQQKAQALSRADMKKIKGGTPTGGGESELCRNGRPCTVMGMPGTCRGFATWGNEEEFIPTCGCAQNNCTPYEPCYMSTSDPQCGSPVA